MLSKGSFLIHGGEFFVNYNSEKLKRSDLKCTCLVLQKAIIFIVVTRQGTRTVDRKFVKVKARRNRTKENWKFGEEKSLFG